MASETTEQNGTFGNPLTDDATRDAAANHPVTQDDLEEALAKIQDTLVEDLLDLYESAWLEGGEQNHLLDTREGVFFAFTPTGFRTREDVRKIDLSDDIFKAVIEAHQNQAAIYKFDVDRPTNYANTYVDDFYPIYIEFPVYWKKGQYHARQRVMYLLSHGLTPTEALDYWAMESGHATLDVDKSRRQWYTSRGVDREAVNKSIRQARDKISEEENQPYYPEQNIETTSTE